MILSIVTETPGLYDGADPEKIDLVDLNSFIRPPGEKKTPVVLKKGVVVCVCVRSMVSSRACQCVNSASKGIQ